MTPEQLRALLEDVAARAVRFGSLPGEALDGPPQGPLFRPTDPRVAGVVADWVTPVAQRWAPRLDLTPRDLARVLAQGLTAQRPVGAVEVAPSGLIALTLTDAARSQIVGTVRDEEDTYALADGERYRLVLERPGWRPSSDPIHRVQLAHARLCRLVRNAEAGGVERRPGTRLEVLNHVSERHLLVGIADLPQRLRTHCGDTAQTHRALVDLAALCEEWQHPVRPMVVGAPVESVHGARLALADTARIVLRNGLARVGAAAPERM
jgi:arginyl-tRNA synthetase